MISRRKKSIYKVLLFTAATAVALLTAADVWARVGGGSSYGGGRSSGGGGGGGGAIIWLIIQLARFLIYLTIEYPLVGIPLDILVIAGIVYYFVRRQRSVETELVSIAEAAPAEEAGNIDVARAFNHLRRFDPNFSEIIFADFCYALYGKAHEARGRGAQALDLFSPYLSQAARSSLLSRNPPGLREVQGIIVGAMQVTDVRDLDTPVVHVRVSFETNYTEVTADKPAGMTYYVRENWELERKRDVLSPTPAEATALHCPRCGALMVILRRITPQELSSPCTFFDSS